MRPLDALEIPLDGMRLIEASAGTGKTHAISTLYLRALLERDLDVSHLLVVTFTNAATEELRDRIRGRLRQALAYLEGTAEPDPDLCALLDTQGDAMRVGKRLADCLTMMDEASVFTIHGFCHRTLRDNAFESGVLFDLELEGDDAALRAELFRDFWRQELGTASVSFVNWVADRWEGPEQLAETLSAIPLNREIELRPVVNAAEFARREAALEPLFRSLSEIWQAGSDEIVKRLQAEGDLKANVYSPGAVGLALESMDRFLAAGAPGGTLPDREVLFRVAKLRSSTRKGRQPPDHAFFAAWTEFAELCRELWTMRRGWFLTKAVSYVRDKMRIREKLSRTVTYDDLLTRMYDALNGPRGEMLAAAIRQRYPVALVDEFQDTDDLQYGIFARVYGDEPDNALFLIGDPKQAIYGFRGADIFTYMRAARTVEDQGGRYTLGTNWRSTRALVKAVNTIFSQGPAPFVFEHDIRFAKVDAAGQAERDPLVVQGDEVSPLRLWWLSRAFAGLDRVDGLIPKDKARQTLAVVAAGEVARLLTLAGSNRANLGGRRLEAGDIAILVRDRFEAELIRKALLGVGVSSIFLSRDSVFESEEAHELQRVLGACAQPHSEAAIRAALCTRIIGDSASKIAGFEEDQTAWDEVVSRFFDYADHWRRGDLLGALHRMIEDYAVVARYLGLPNGERRLTNLLQLAELLDRASRAKPGADRLLRWFALRRGGREKTLEEAQLRLESDEGLVKIVTLHGSKGLEYPVVFLPFAWTARPVTASNVVTFHQDGELVVDLCPDAAGPSVNAADRERLAEEIRLLYVALTRAMHRCYVGWGPVSGGDDSAMGYLLHRGKKKAPVADLKQEDATLLADLTALESRAAGSIGVEVLTAVEPKHSSGLELGADTLAPRPFRGVVEREFCVTSYSGLIRTADDSGERPERDERPSVEHETAGLVENPAFRFPRGPRAGTFLHAVFEQIDFDKDTFDFRAYTRLKQIKYLRSTEQIDDHFFWKF